jgi:multidrug efflux system membrane fusion protein
MTRYLLLLALVSLLCLIGCKKKDTEEESGAPPKPVVAVRTVPVTMGTANIEVQAVGKTEALRQQDIVSPIAGRLISLTVKEGDRLKAGDVLATIQTRESQAALDGAKALLRMAKTDNEKVEAQRMMALAESSQAVVHVSSPFNGVVSSRQATEGAILTENTLLLTLVDLSTVVFVGDVYLHDLGSVELGQRSRIHLESAPETNYDAAVDAINPESESESQSVRVRFRFTSLRPGNPPLRTGMAGTARIIVGAHEGAMLLPGAALLRNDETNSFSVVIVGTDSLSHTVPVELGLTSDSLLEVISDHLKPGMRVIVEGQYGLADSTRVTLIQ